jgi:spermine oxidase
MYRCKCENIENGSQTLTSLSSNNFCIWKELKGSQVMELKYGYKNILKLIINNHANQFNSRLRLKHALKKILICSSQSDCLHCTHTPEKDRIVLIITDLDSTKDLIVICENVVCTMSLGYMKDNLARLIEPNSFIPKEKLLAVSRLGYGTVNKIFLVYDKPFWKKNMNGFHPIWLLKKNETVLSKLDEINETNWFENISYFETVKDHKNILVAWCSGDFVEKLSDEKINHDCTMVLRKFFNDNNIPEPIKIIKYKNNF